VSGEALRRLLAVLVLALVLVAVGTGMVRGWRARGRRQSGIAAPRVPPADLGGPAFTLTGTYVSTTTAGQFLDRVVAHGLGPRAAAELAVHPSGLVLSRDGADPLFVPAADVVGLGDSAGMAGKVLARPEILLIRWRAGDTVLDTGFRPGSRADRADVPALAARTAAALHLLAAPLPGARTDREVA